MYDKRSEYIQDNMTPRSVKYFTHFSDDDQRIMFGGLQGFIKWYFIEMFQKNFFDLPKDEALKEYKEITDLLVGEGVTEMWGFEKLHDLGYLPIEIRALPEGTLVPVQVPMYTIQNTHPDFYWLPNFLESVMSSETWKTITTATTFWQYRKLSEKWATKTCDDNSHVPFQNHCFAYRGESGTHDAAQSEFGQMMNSMGTDTLPAIAYANKYYGMKGKPSSFSVPASEHSVITTNIGSIVNRLKKEKPSLTLDELRYEAEVEFLKKYVTEIFPKGIVSYVSDSYDYFTMITKGLVELKDEIMNRDGKLVIRPDSGTPEHIIAGYRSLGEFSTFDEAYDALSSCKGNEELAKIGDDWHRIYGDEDGYFFDKLKSGLTDAEVKGSIEILWEIFGGTVNNKGYKVLDSHIGLIYGDSITVKRAKEIFERLEERGFASSNIVNGVGSFSLQVVSRDSLGMAVKATGAVIDGEQIMVSKEPKTDLGKKSAKGFLKVIRNENGELELKDNLTIEEVDLPDNELRTVFKDGKLLIDEDLTTIRQRVTDNLG